MDSKALLSVALFEAGVVKFGTFTLKSGMKSPIYIDLRVLVSHPELLRRVGREIKTLAEPLTFDRIVGIPYAAIAIATAVGLESGWPMIYTRKEAKEYGTRRTIEGVYQPGEKVLMIDDIITDGASKLEVIHPLREAKLAVHDVAVVIDREQGGEEILRKEGIALHAVLKVSELIEGLRKAEKIKEEVYWDVRTYFEQPDRWRPGA